MDDRMDELLGELTPDTEDLSVDPWRRPIRLIIWGILLTTVTLNFLNLDMLLPGVGLILMCLGFRPLRRENGGFRVCWVLSILRLIFALAVDMVYATPFEYGSLTTLFYIPGAVLQLAQLFALRAGLAGVFDRAGAERRLTSMNWLIAMQFLVAFLGLLNVGNMGILGLGLLALYVGIIVTLFKLPKALGDTGYALRNAPVRLGDLPTAIVGCVTFALLVAGAYFAGIAMRVPASRPYVPNETALSLPTDMAELLTTGEAALFEDAVDIQYKFREPETLPDGTKIQFCTAVAELSEHRLLILHYFRYLEGGPKYSDGFDSWMSARFTRWVRPDTGSSQPTGAIVFEQDGLTRRAPIRDLEGGYAVTHGILWDDAGDRVSGNVYAPPDAENVRGYVLYMVRAQVNTPLNYNCCINFLHTKVFDTFRRGTPAQMLFNGFADSHWKVIHFTDFTSFLGDAPEEDPENYGFTVTGIFS